MRKKIIICTMLFTIITIFCSSCSKDAILDTFKEMNEMVGDHVLTDTNDLKGKRTFGIDHYTGSYEVTYYDFKGTEIIFGGATIGRDNGENIHIKLVIENSDGNIQIFMKLKESKELLASSDGTYEYDFNVKDGSNYFMIKGDPYSGKITVMIE